MLSPSCHRDLNPGRDLPIIGYGAAVADTQNRGYPDSSLLSEITVAIEVHNLISAFLLRLRMKSPFFATLALFARLLPSHSIDTAATDGRDIFFNPDYIDSLRPAQQEGLLLHEVLHAALIHALRRGVRDPKLWNIAADIVVNGIIAQQGVFTLPPEPLRNTTLEHLSVEEIYELLQDQDSKTQKLPHPDLLSQAPVDAGAGAAVGESAPSNCPVEHQQTNTSRHQNDDRSDQSTNHAASNSGPKEDTPAETLAPSSPPAPPTQTQPNASTSQPQSDSLSAAHKAAVEAHWRHALQQATVLARTTSQGHLPAGMDRELGLLTVPQLDWRTYLWRYLVQTPTDFLGFDRRFIGQGLYLEALVGESVRVFVAVDTSGSIDAQALRLFLSEVQGILNAYPHLQCELYFADADAYGPHELDPNSPLPQPQGGGGTSFVPFFDKVDDRWNRLTQAVCVYLTDGYSDFPDVAPELPTLWVVTPGGLALEAFPFGEAVRLLSV